MSALVTGQIYPFMHNITNILHPYYANSKYEILFNGNFVNVVENFNETLWRGVSWNPLNLKQYSDDYRIYCTLGWVLKCMEELLARENTTASEKYYLTLYLDMYIPLVIYIEDSGEGSNNHLLTQTTEDTEEEQAPIERFMPDMKLVFHEGNLPDVLNYVVQCSFFTENRNKLNPIVHLISKALPHRCTIRNLIEITSKNCRKYDDVYNFVFGCLKCSLLGLYETCIHRPNMQTRIKLIRKFCTVSKGYMLKWMTSDHQQLLFYVIKEFLIYAVRQIPGLYEEIKERYYWDKFEECVEKAMDSVRREISTNTEDIMKFPGVEHKLSISNKQQVTHLYRPTKHSFAKVLLMECDRLDDSKAVDYISTEFKKEHRDIMYKMAIRTEMSLAMPFEWLQYFNINQNVQKELKQIQETYLMDGQKTALKSLLSGLDRYSFEYVRAFAEVFDRKMNVRIFTAPKHIYVQQCKALRRKFKIPNGKPLPKTVGNTLVCMECKQFKGFTNKVDTKQKGNKNVSIYKNLYGLGNKKTLVDDLTMKLFCGKRCDKVDAKKRHHYTPDLSSYISTENAELARQNMERARKRAAKERRKELKNDICSDTELTTVDLCGNILQFYGSLYTVCPMCGNFMSMESKYYTKDGFYCGCCIQNGKLYTNITCEYCKAVRGNETWNSILVYKEDENSGVDKLTAIYLCSGCHKPWIKSATSPLTLDTILKGLHNKWKRLQHPSTV